MDVEDELDVLDFPEFEAFDQDDRPPPPAEDDFPVGCYVELVDIATAKTAQTEEYWEPFMDSLFRPKRRVLVKRHIGEYTYIVCDDDPEFIVGATLYRACLKEPKVKMRKYIPQTEDDSPMNPMAPATMVMAPSIVDEKNDDGLFTVMETGDDEDDALAVPIMPTNSNSIPIPAGSVMPPQNIGQGTAAMGSSKQDSVHRVPVPSSILVAGASTHSHHNSSGSAAGGSQHHLPQYLPNPANAAKAKKLTRKGNVAFAESNFESAIKYYTESLELDRTDASRLLSNRSASYLALRNAELALADARAVMKLTPKSHVGYVRAGNVFRQLKRFDEAKLCYEKAMSLDPTKSRELEYSLISNAVAAVYRAKTEHIPINVNLNKQMKIFGTSKRKFKEGEVVWTETSSMVVPICNTSTHGSSSQQRQGQGKFCWQCFKSLAKVDDIAAQLPGVEMSFLSNLHKEANVIACHEGCGHWYCSEQCRAKAWTDHHWIECRSKGKWAAASSDIAAALQLGVEANIPPYLIACVQLTIRMIVQVMSSSKPLPDAINNFSWLRQVFPFTSDDTLVIDQLLKPVYFALQQCLTRDEKGLLDFTFVVKLYSKCRANAVRIVATPWPGIKSRLETHISLLSERGEQHQGLDKILNSSAADTAALGVQCLALYEIFAAVSLDPLDDAHSLGPNVAVKPEGETASVGSFAAVRAIDRGNQIFAHI